MASVVTEAELEERAGGGFPLSRPVTAESITDPPERVPRRGNRPILGEPPPRGPIVAEEAATRPAV